VRQADDGVPGVGHARGVVARANQAQCPHQLDLRRVDQVVRPVEPHRGVLGGADPAELAEPRVDITLDLVHVVL
jgi:hypothetical protein